MRAASLTQQSLWLDEVYSLIFVRGTLAEAWRNGIFPAQNPHAPAYYLPFWAWAKLAGESALAARWFSLLAGVGGLAALWRLARDVAGPRAAHVALAVLALSPFGIWHSQEARQYAQYLLLAALVALLLFRATRTGPKALSCASEATAEDDAGEGWVGANTPRPMLFIGFAALALLMAYTHFFAVFTLPAYAMAGFALAWHRRRHLLWWMATLTVIALACMPIPLALLGSGRTFDQADVTRQLQNPLQMLVASSTEFLLRKPVWEEVALWFILLIAGALGAWGLISLWRAQAEACGYGTRARRAALVLGMLTLGPLLTFWPASYWVSIFSPKYALSILPPLLIALAHGIAQLPWRLLRAGALALVLGAGLAAHARDLTDPQSQREHWGYVAQYLRANAAPDDKVVVFADYAQPVLDYHFDGPNELIRFLDEPMAPEAFYDKVQQGSYRNLWLVLAHDQVAKPGHRIVDVANARYPWAYAQYPNSGFIRVLGYNVRWRHSALPATASSTSAVFENGVRLVGYRIDPTRLPATERLSHPPSNWIHVTAYWQSAGVDAATPHARPFVRMVGEAGEWGGELARIPNVFEFDPPKGWPVGTIIESHHDVNLNPVTPPGRYAMVIGLATDDGRRLPLRDAPGTAHEVGEVEIVR